MSGFWGFGVLGFWGFKEVSQNKQAKFTPKYFENRSREYSNVRLLTKRRAN